MSANLDDYLSSLQPIRDPILLQMKDYAAKHKVPIMEDASIEVLLSLIKLKQPKTILEIGTAIGYSATRMAQACPTSKIITCDIDEERLAVAKAFLHDAKLTERIELIHGDAIERISTIEEHAPYDVIFIDAAKGQYKNYFDSFSPLLFEHGVVISDNVFFRGMIASMEQPIKKYRTAVNRLREYNDFLAKHPHFDTSFYPVGDGLAVSIKT